MKFKIKLVGREANFTDNNGNKPLDYESPLFEHIGVDPNAPPLKEFDITKIENIYARNGYNIILTLNKNFNGSGRVNNFKIYYDNIVLDSEKYDFIGLYSSNIITFMAIKNDVDIIGKRYKIVYDPTPENLNKITSVDGDILEPFIRDNLLFTDRDLPEIENSFGKIIETGGGNLSFSNDYNLDADAIQILFTFNRPYSEEVTINLNNTTIFKGMSLIYNGNRYPIDGLTIDTDHLRFGFLRFNRIEIYKIVGDESLTEMTFQIEIEPQDGYFTNKYGSSGEKVFTTRELKHTR